ncbi:MAG: signal peptidase I [Opitutaceae bacterium]|nr:signal peptidase I [Opitutaceae bacterium]
MFSFLYSEQKKMRQNAANWLEVAERVQHYRRDLLTAAQNQRLQTAAGEVRLRLKERADASKLKLAIESLESVLRDTGGRIYPASSLVENVEFFLVAAIVILGLRAYFVQPFKIPTNSMWPSYYGMTSEVFHPGEEPGPVQKLARLATLGATNYALKAPADGEVCVPVFSSGQLAVSERPGRSMLVFPTVLREYTFSIGGSLVKMSVPADFDREHDVLKQTFFGERKGTFSTILRAKIRESGTPPESSILALQDGERRGDVRVYWIPVGRAVKRGETVVSFDILTGDLLFVDRLSYNFVQPKVGSGFVFKTGGIPDLKTEEGDKYYVKRLVGVPGDELEIRAPVLWRNGSPIQGSPAFAKNARREGKYRGYTNNSAPFDAGDYTVMIGAGLMPPGATVKVPENTYFALGDNSPFSKDSRYWGFVPDKDVVGRPLFIYYPLTSRWGLAH